MISKALRRLNCTKTPPRDDLWIFLFEPTGHDAEKKSDLLRCSTSEENAIGGTVIQFEQYTNYLKSRRMVTFEVDYRVKSRQKTAPDACVADGKSAIRWVRTNAEQRDFDPDRIAAGKRSAGRHVPATTGICEELDDPAEKNSIISARRMICCCSRLHATTAESKNGFQDFARKPWSPTENAAESLDGLTSVSK